MLHNKLGCNMLYSIHTHYLITIFIYRDGRSIYMCYNINKLMEEKKFQDLDLHYYCPIFVHDTKSLNSFHKSCYNTYIFSCPQVQYNKSLFTFTSLINSLLYICTYLSICMCVYILFTEQFN